MMLGHRGQVWASVLRVYSYSYKLATVLDVGVGTSRAPVWTRGARRPNKAWETWNSQALVLVM